MFCDLKVTIKLDRFNKIHFYGLLPLKVALLGGATCPLMSGKCSGLIVDEVVCEL